MISEAGKNFSQEPYLKKIKILKVAILKYRGHCAELEIYSIKLLTKIQTGRNLSWVSKYTTLL